MTPPVTPKPSLPLRSVEQERWRIDRAKGEFYAGRFTYEFAPEDFDKFDQLRSTHNTALDRLTQERDEARELLFETLLVCNHVAGELLIVAPKNHAITVLDELRGKIEGGPLSSNASGVAAKGKEGDATCPETTSLLRGSDAAPVVQSDSVAATPASGAPTETDEEKKQTGEPSVIYLQYHGDGDPDDESLVRDNDVTWCRDKIFEHDIKYVRAGAPKNQTLRG